MIPEDSMTATLDDTQIEDDSTDLEAESKVNEAIQYLELALKRSKEAAVYQLAAAVGTEFLECMDPNAAYEKKIAADTISSSEKLSLYGPYTILLRGLWTKDVPAPSRMAFLTQPIVFIGKQAKYNEWRRVSGLYKEFSRGTYLDKDQKPQVKVQVSDEDQQNLQREYIIALTKIFTNNKEKEGVRKYCLGLDMKRFAMLKADPKEDIKVKKEEQSIANPAPTSRGPMTISSSASLVATWPPSTPPAKPSHKSSLSSSSHHLTDSGSQPDPLTDSGSSQGSSQSDVSSQSDTDMTDSAKTAANSSTPALTPAFSALNRTPLVAPKVPGKDPAKPN